MFFKIKKFFFENTGLKQTIVKNTFWLTLAETVSRFLRLILIIYIARVLGAAEYGKFTFALAFVSLFAIIADFGISSIVTREISQEKEREKEFASVFSLKMIFSIGALALMLLSSFLITKDLAIQKIIWILAFFIVIDSFSEIIYAFLRARQKMEYESLAKISQALLLAGIGFFIIFKNPSVVILSSGYLLSSFITLLGLLIFFHFKIFKIRLAFDKRIWKKFLVYSWPLAVAGISSAIYSQIDSVMMGYWGYITQTGWYNAAYRIIAAALIPGAMVATSFTPVLNIAYKESKEKFFKVCRYFMGTMIFLALPIFVGGAVLAPKIIDWVYDIDFFPSVFAMQILLGIVVITYLLYPLGAILLVLNYQKKTFWIVLAGAVINVFLNLILIPKFDLYGAALSTLITYIVLLALIFKFVDLYSPMRWLTSASSLTLSGVVFASAVLFFVIKQPLIYNLHTALCIFVGAGVYFSSFFLYKELLRRLLNRFIIWT